MQQTQLKSSLILALAALIWGVAYVAQRAGMDYMGPYSFNAFRFLLGTLSLLPVLYFTRHHPSEQIQGNGYSLLIAGVATGSLMFLACSLQQVGLVSTTAGKAGFITGMNIVLVPIFGILLRHKTGGNTWLGVLLASIGMYLLSVTDEWHMQQGDLLILICAVVWAIHILTIDHFAKRVPLIKLAFLQFLICTLWSFAVAFNRETWHSSNLIAAWLPLAYAGIMSVGVAFTLQIIGQKGAQAAHAAVLLSFEAVCAAVAGWLLLDETMSARSLLGCSLMLLGILISQVRWSGFKLFAVSVNKSLPS